MPSSTATGSRRAARRSRRRARVGRAPIAATSVRFVAAAFQPRSNGVDHASRKSGPCTIRSLVTTNRPSAAATTAASSPGAEERRVARPEPRQDAPEHRRLAELADRGRGRRAGAVPWPHGSLNAMPAPRSRGAPRTRRGASPRPPSPSPRCARSRAAARPCRSTPRRRRATPTAPPSSCACPTRSPASASARDERAGHGRVGLARVGAAAMRRRAARPDDRPLRERRRRRLGHRRVRRPALPLRRPTGARPPSRSLVDNDVVSGTTVIADLSAAVAAIPAEGGSHRPRGRLAGGRMTASAAPRGDARRASMSSAMSSG